MNKITVCLILNVFALSAYAAELWKDYDVILDNTELVKSRCKYTVRLITSSIIFIIALSAMYSLFNINTADVSYYFKYGGR